jgi:tRNA pseudouridine38-40 synthase
MGKGYQGKPKYNRKRSRDDEDDDNYDRKSFDERHKGSFPLEEVKASEDYSRRSESVGPKRKYAICLGYLGTNYRGLQINPDTKSIEQELERALFLSGGIIEANYGYLQKIQWSRSARTDAGVHAVAQCCSMRLTMSDNKSLFIDKINSFLPQDIRVHTITKVTKAFNAKLYCVKRRYQYIMPTYLLFDQSKAEEYMNALLLNDDVTVTPYVTFADTPLETSKTVNTLAGKSLSLVRDFIKSFRITDVMLALLKQALGRYVGTNNYHNFTSGKSFKDANSLRYIISFDCSDPFIAPSGVEYVLLSVVGQSFLLNQIRKMIAMAIEVARGGVPLTAMDTAFSSELVSLFAYL